LACPRYRAGSDHDQHCDDHDEQLGEHFQRLGRREHVQDVPQQAQQQDENDDVTTSAISE
jgi:hypothetical protein